jgi:predicted ferric reductase
MQNALPGTKVILEGPYGVFTETRRSKDDVVLVAAGIGAPPIRALAESIDSNGKVSIIYRVRSKADAALLSELEQIANERNFKLHVVEGKRRSDSSWLPWSFNQSISDEKALEQMTGDIRNSDVYICGPTQFTHQVSKSLEKLAVPKKQIHAEEFAW